MRSSSVPLKCLKELAIKINHVFQVNSEVMDLFTLDKEKFKESHKELLYLRTRGPNNELQLEKFILCHCLNFGGQLDTESLKNSGLDALIHFSFSNSLQRTQLSARGCQMKSPLSAMRPRVSSARRA